MTLRDQLAELVSACFTGIWILSHEHQDALTEIAQMCRDENWRLAVWNVSRGMQLPGQTAAAQDAGGADPLAALRALDALAAADSSAILVLTNFHRFLGNPEIVQALAEQVAAGKQRRTFVVILAAVVQIPVEIEKAFTVVEHELPDRAQLAEIARGVATEPGELPEGPPLEQLLDAAAGLTRIEVENAFSLGLVRHRRLEASTIWQLKAAELKKSNLLTLYRGEESFAGLGGLEALKSFCLRALRPKDSSKPKARGIVLLGPPGTGKTAVAKALGNETGRPTLLLDPGSLMASLVGQTEERTRQALRIIDAFGPSIVVIDEVDHALAGHNSSGDSGVMSRFFGTMQSWLSDHRSDAFVVCTSNNISALPAAFTRAERFDGVFYVGLPGRMKPSYPLRPLTYRTLLGLMASTGLRISEALKLTRGHVDLERDILRIEQSKFKKSRLIPLHPTATRALYRYAAARDHQWGQDGKKPFFVGRCGLALPYGTVFWAFRDLCNDLGWCQGNGERPRPRIHDLRHSFACRRLLLWCRNRENVNQLIAALSTYLGHGKVTDTYWYLTGTPELMAIAGGRFERFARPRKGGPS